jgi:hypothetical protein
MRFTYSNFKQQLSRAVKPVLLTLVISSVTLGALAAYVASERFRVTADLDLALCEPDHLGGWKVLDRLRSNVSFESTLTDLAAGRDVRSNDSWSPRSERGCAFSVRLVRPGRQKWDTANGVYELELPIEVSLKGKNIPLTLKLTSESLSTPLGDLTGQDAVWANKTLSAGLVGVARFRADRNLFNCGVVGSGNPGSAGNNANQEFVLVSKGSGRAVLVD